MVEGSDSDNSKTVDSLSGAAMIPLISRFG
jgi:hypothetical protein